MSKYFAMFFSVSLLKMSTVFMWVKIMKKQIEIIIKRKKLPRHCLTPASLSCVTLAMTSGFDCARNGEWLRQAQPP